MSECLTSAGAKSGQCRKFKYPLVPRQGLEFKLSHAYREGEAPAEPRAKDDVISRERLGRSLALPKGANPKIKP